MITNNLLEDITNLADIKRKVVEQNLSDKYYHIAKIFLDVLGVDKISIHDDLSVFGIESLSMVSIVAKLQKNYKISMDDFLKLRTIAKVAEFAPFVKNNLTQQLEKVKLAYAKKERCLVHDVEEVLAKQIRYLQEVERIRVKKQQKKIHNVLLTGSTGHVGCNILDQLLRETSYNIYLPIRAVSFEEASNRINNKFKYYFDIDLSSYKDRITILVADLVQSNLGLDEKQYRELVSNIDSIIHSAALVKHYGTYDEAYQTNVQSTINLLELAKLTTNKDFHYVSTLGVLVQDGYIPNCSYFAFHEDDDAGILVNRNNTYAKTKYEGELIVNKYRNYGVNSSIYRLGNVAMHSITSRHQENITDNAFFIQLKTILKLGMMYKELAIAEVSPVDLTAKAIVRLFDQVDCSNKTYHISNPYLCDLNRLFVGKNLSVEVLSIEEFIDRISHTISSNAYEDKTKSIELFMLHQKWLQQIDSDNVTQIKILQDKTNHILVKLGFIWTEITENMWFDIMNRIEKGE
jgi:thioester reductase-like protein